MRRQTTSAVRALLLHGLALRQEGTWTPCLSAVWVARMSHSKAAVGTKCLPCLALSCAPPHPGASSASFAPHRHLVSPHSRAVQGKVRGSVLGTGGSVWQPCTLSGSPSQQCGMVGAGGTVCSLETMHRPCGWHRSCAFPGRGAPPHAGVPVGLCPVGAAHPTAGSGLGMCWGMGVM